MKKVIIFFLTVLVFKSHSVFAEAGLNLKMETELNSQKTAQNKKPVTKKPVTQKPVTKKPIDKQQTDKTLDLKPEKEMVIEKKEPPKEVPIVIVPKDAYPMEDVLKMQNDKEVLINVFSVEEKNRILLKYSSIDEQKRFKNVFYKKMHLFLNANDSLCETTFVAQLINELEKQNVGKNETEINDVFKLLRSIGAIDDLMFEILEKVTADYFAVGALDLNAKAYKNVFKDYVKKSEGYDLNIFFERFIKFPDGVQSCAYREFAKLQNAVGDKKDSLRTRNGILKDLIYKAYEEKVISLASFHKLRFLADSSTMNKRSFWLMDYVRTTIQAKNKMLPKKSNYKIVNLEEENAYSSELKGRFNKISRRKILYSKYEASQIVLLSQVMKKASQRMGVDVDTKSGIPYLIQEFQILNEGGDYENYVEKIELDTQSQYNLARRLLRKDMLALQMMTSFRDVIITYDDLVMASLETGYISLDDISYVVKYDDLWNPEVSKKDKMLGIAFRLVGYSTFFLPPPWNVTGALALSIIEGIVESKKINGADNDNPNTFIE